MTQTARPRTGVRRPGAIYGLDIADHDTLIAAAVHKVMKDDYVGQTRQKGRARESQHRDDKPYEDLIVGSAHVLEQGMWTDEELDEREVYWIRRLCPRMNYEHNLDNPDRIEIWRQKEQRWVRDDAAGRARWVPLEQRQPSGLLDQPMAFRSATASAVRRPNSPHSWSPRRIKACLWSSAWGMTAVVMSGYSSQLALFPTWPKNLLCGSVISAVLLVWSLAGAPLTRRQWRRLRRRGLRRWMH